MLKLRTILLSDKLYILILVIVLIISSIRLIIPKKSTINDKTKYVEGIIIDYKINDDKIIITVKNNEKYLIYCNDFNQLKKIKVGIKIKAYGSLNQPSKQTNINTFDYKKYLYNKNIFYIVTAKKIEIINSEINIYYKIKNYLLKKTKINPYLRAFILGDKSLIDKKVLESFQENGISHLFAISGMHISLLSAIILNTLKKLKIKENSRYFYTSIFLILYLSQIGLSPSALRGVLFFILFSINKIYYFYIKPFNIALVVFCITLLINPYFIYDIGFQFSFSISIALILMSKKITGNYLQKLFKVSLISFFTSTPISLYNYYQLNLLSIIYNLFFVPLVSLIIFPMSLIALALPINPIYNILTSLLEKISLTLGNINIGKIIFKKLNIYFYLIYYLVLILIYIYRDKKIKRLITIYIGIIIIHFFIPNIYRETYVIMLDVGQGDSTIIYSNNTCIVIDTGGKVSNKNENSTISKQIIIPILKSLGIKKIDYLILTHGH